MTTADATVHKKIVDISIPKKVVEEITRLLQMTTHRVPHGGTDCWRDGELFGQLSRSTKMLFRGPTFFAAYLKRNLYKFELDCGRVRYPHRNRPGTQVSYVFWSTRDECNKESHDEFPVDFHDEEQEAA